MNTDIIIQNTFGQVMTNAAQAMSEAVKQYGPDAVELGLVVYRISALQQILLGVVFVGLFVVLIVLSKWVHNLGVVYSNAGGYDPFKYQMLTVLIAGSAGCSVIFGVRLLLNVYSWAALLGYPEILIAYKALVAAGLM